MRAFRALREPSLFYGVGILNTLIDIGLFLLLSGAFHLEYLLAQVVSYTVGAANSYLLNRTFTFRRKNPPHPLEALRFAGVNAASLGLASLLLYLSQHLHGGLASAKVVATLLGALVNYAGNRYWVFAGSVKAPERASFKAAGRPNEGPGSLGRTDVATEDAAAPCSMLKVAR